MHGRSVYAWRVNVAIGDIVGGKYRLVKLLGEGGMGAVYEAVQEPLNRRCALKVLHKALASDATLVARFKREAEVAASLGHPNIVQVTDFGFDDGKAFLVMDYLTGEPLASAMERGPMAPERIRFIAAQVLSALDAAHARDIVHRDLKPDNIFLTSVSGVRDMVKLLDFGIARMTDVDQKMTTTGQVLGTPAYMSPEQARGRAVDHRTDLYSLGVLMYEALSGRMPVSGSNYHELMFNIVGETPTPLAELCPQLDPGLVAVVERAMAKEVENRFQSAKEMRAAIEALGPVSATPQASVPSQPPAASPAASPAGGPTTDPLAATVTPAAVPALASDPPPAATPAALASTTPATPVAPAVTTPSSSAPSRGRGLLVGAVVVALLAVGVAAYALTRGPDAVAANTSDTAPTTSHELPEMDAPPPEPEDTADRIAEAVEERIEEAVERRLAELADSTMSEAPDTEASTAMSTESAMTGAPENAPRMSSMAHMRAHPDRPTRDAYGNRIEWIECGANNYLKEVYPIRRNHQLRFTSLNAGRVVELNDLRPVVQGEEVSRGATACYVGHLFNNGQNWILEVDAEGKVQRVRPHVYCPIDPAVTRCMRNLLEGRQFPPAQNAPGEIRIGLGLRGA